MMGCGFHHYNDMLKKKKSGQYLMDCWSSLDPNLRKQDSTAENKKCTYALKLHL